MIVMLYRQTTREDREERINEHKILYNNKNTEFAEQCMENTKTKG